MKRRVIKQGPSTLMVSLPAAWVKKYDVERGDMLDMDLLDRKIVLSTDKDLDIEALEIDVRGLDLKHVKRYLHELYKVGYEELKILCEDSEMVPAMQDFISKVMVGYEVVDQHEHSLHVKSISKAIDQEFDSILRRVFLVTKQLGENSYAAIEKKNWKGLSNVLILEETNDKLTNFCQRVLNKKGYTDFKKTNFLYCLIWQLEKIADEYKYICSYLTRTKEPLTKEVLELYSDVNALFWEFYTLKYNYTKEGVMEFSKNAEILIKKSVDILADKSAKPNQVISGLSVLASKIYNLLGPLIGTKV